MATTGRRAGQATAALALAATALSTWALTAHAATADSATLRATGPQGTVVTGADQVTLGGDTEVQVDVAELDGGHVKVAAGPDQALPRAWDFPAYLGTGTYPRAVMSVRPTSGDGLSPGAADFRFGAVFRLDRTSSGRTADNGDNIFQRGRYSEPSLFKLQVDHGFPSCQVKGSGGSVMVQSSVKVTPDAWYSATCSRVGSAVTIAVTPYAGAGPTVRDQEIGRTGTLSFSSARMASVGGKLASSGVAVSPSSDQLNGAVAEVSVRRL